MVSVGVILVHLIFTGSPVMLALLVSSPHRGGDGDSEGLGNLPKVVRLVSGDLNSVGLHLPLNKTRRARSPRTALWEPRCLVSRLREGPSGEVAIDALTAHGSSWIEDKI